MDAAGKPKALASVLEGLREATQAVGPHTLSPAPVAVAKAKLVSTVKAVRDANTARTAWGDDAERVARVKTDAAQRVATLNDVKSTITKCRDMARLADPFAHWHELVLQRVKAAAVAAGAQADEGLPVEMSAGRDDPGAGESPGPLLTVCGSTFLSDFQFYTSDLTVDFRHLSGSEEIRDKDVDTDFRNMVRNDDFGGLRRAFERLMEQERLDITLKPSVSMKECLRVLEDDLLSIQAAELASHHEFSTDTITNRGHGSMRRTACGLRVEFAPGRAAFLEIEHAVGTQTIAAASLSPSVSPDAVAGALPLKFAFAEPTRTTETPAHFVLRLEEPLVMSVALALELEAIHGATVAATAMYTSAPPDALSNLENGVALSSQSTSASVAATVRSVAAGHAPEYTVSAELEVLLATAAFLDAASQPGSTEQRAPNPVSAWTAEDEIVVTTALPGKKFVRFSYNRADCHPGVLVYRVPFLHPKDVPEILQMFRRQLVFNQLFASCFCSARPVDDDAKPELDQPVEVVVCEPPELIHLGAFDPTTDSALNVAVNVDRDGQVSVRIRPSQGRNHPCSDEKATALLKACNSIPLLIEAVRAVAQHERESRAAPEVIDLS